MSLDKLKEEMPYKWRTQSVNQYNTILVAYIDARDVEDVFDTHVGPDKWQCKYSMVGEQMICDIGVYCNDQWVWKSDGGTKTDIEGEKGLLSDSFKGAAVKWGPGRFLYRLTPIKLPSIDTGRTKNNKPVYAQMHDVKKYGAVQDVPKGIIQWGKDSNGKLNLTLQIKDVDAYVNKFLKPWKENKNK